MRLLHTSTLKLHEFVKNIPQYAILSHTWEDDEVLFQDLQALSSIPYPFHLLLAMRKKRGLQKVRMACKHAAKYGFTWIWIDSCCINKESSSELSEAINSMYVYYQGARVCYAYLCDVRITRAMISTGKADDPVSTIVVDSSPRSAYSDFKQCKWFTRGWTLQELLAPSNVVFFDQEWVQIGTKWDLNDVITAITGIPTRVLLHDGDIRDTSIAKRMSWAAHRQTTREEDRAYSLMGIFGVNMPPIYGEGGERAFSRLQHEIIKQSNDRSIFAWIASPSDSPEKSSNRGLFARSPYEFRASGEVTTSDSMVIGRLSSYTLTNDGLRIHLPLICDVSDTEGLSFLEDSDTKGNNEIFLAFLNCRSEKSGEHLAVHLRKQPESEHQFSRCHANQLILTDSYEPKTGDLQDVFIKEESTLTTTLSNGGNWRKPSSVTFKIRQLPSLSSYRYGLRYAKCLGIPVKQRKRKDELTARCTGWGKGSDKLVALKYTVTSRGGSTHSTASHSSSTGPDEESFILLAGINDGTVFCDVLTGSQCDSFQDRNSLHGEKIHDRESEFLRQRSNKIIKPLEFGGVVSVDIHPGADTPQSTSTKQDGRSNSFREDVVVLELRIIPSEMFFQGELTTIASSSGSSSTLLGSNIKSELYEPNYGFMVEHPPSVVSVEAVYPEDFHFRYHVHGNFFLSSHTPTFVPGSFFLSIDSAGTSSCPTKQSEPPSLMKSNSFSRPSPTTAHSTTHDFRVLRCQLFPPHGPGFYLVLGVDAESGAWTDIIGTEEAVVLWQTTSKAGGIKEDEQQAVLESIWRSYLNPSSGRDEDLSSAKVKPVICLPLGHGHASRAQAARTKDSAQVIVGGEKWAYSPSSRRWMVKVRIGKRTGLQLGSHWARIELEPASSYVE
ncbi:HET-domain-containing protein [Dendrothele bispora CBS 962.96]|uniref:HET-domain-containing protein n=1 Tax=Dendrothele bispora (strain CBS 962.96) TaxID=1314807 RepID=A0A4S8M0Q7_DENBC|nr:HET-domain-containing protein [Dendrothele bispora CBS 962.96]